MRNGSRVIGSKEKKGKERQETHSDKKRTLPTLSRARILLHGLGSGRSGEIGEVGSNGGTAKRIGSHGTREAGSAHHAPPKLLSNTSSTLLNSLSTPPPFSLSLLDQKNEDCNEFLSPPSLNTPLTTLTSVATVNPPLQRKTPRCNGGYSVATEQPALQRKSLRYNGRDRNTQQQNTQKTEARRILHVVPGPSSGTLTSPPTEKSA
jgi:hypothetical protein